MNWKTTAALLILGATAVGFWHFGLHLPAQLQPTHPAAEVADGGSRQILANITPATLTRIEIRRADDQTILERKGVGVGETWALPGGWPTRGAEVQALVDLLGSLRSRFLPEPAENLARVGLDKPVITVLITAAAESHTLAFGEARESAGEGEGNRFSRPTDVRIDNKPEILRLGPGVLSALRQPTDYYQQRRLFPFERVAKEGNKQEKTELLFAKAVSVDDKMKDGVHFSVQRSADGWELTGPTHDHLDPRARTALLAAIPDIWAEQFSKATTDAAGLSSPERTIEVLRDDGTKVTLLIGKVSSTKSRKVMRRPPPGMPAPTPPREETVTEEYRFAKLEGNPQIFEVKADKLKDVFVALDTLRDAQVVRFKTEDARQVQITQNGSAIDLGRDGEAERWKLTRPLQADADTAKITELLTKISGLEARDKDVLDAAKPADYGLDKPTAVIDLTLEEASGETKKQRKFALAIGKHDAKEKKLYVQLAGWPRINRVDDSLLSLATRPALAYRGKRVLDLVAADLATVEIVRGTEVVKFQQEKGTWKLTAPINADADLSKTVALVSSLAGLEAVEFVADAPAAVDLDKDYGLSPSAPRVVLTPTNPASPPRTLFIGKQRGAGKTGTFAKLADAPAVFAISDETRASLERPALAYLPTQLWQLSSADLVSVKVKKDKQDEYTLTSKDGGFAIAGPFDAPAMSAIAQPIVDELSHPSVENYVEAQPKNLQEYGLDAPYLRVAVAGKDGKTRTLLLGKEAPKGGRFVRMEDRPAVGVLAAKAVAALDRGALDLLDPVVLIVDIGRADRFEITVAGATTRVEKQGAAWRVLGSPASPFDADPDAVASVTGALFNVKADRIAAYGPKVDWPTFLGNPHATVKIHVAKTPDRAEEEHTVVIGNPATGGRYARVDAGPAAVVFGPASLANLTKSYLDFVPRRMLQFSSLSATSIKRENGPDSLELTRRDDGWQIAKQDNQAVNLPADAKAVSDLLAALSDLRAQRIVAFPVKNPDDFGFNKPKAVFTVTFPASAKPASVQLNIGKLTDDKTGERYAMTSTGSAVAVLPASILQRFLAPPLAFRERTLAKFADADQLQLERGPRRATFARVDGTWKLTEPLSADADQESLDDFLSQLAKLRADELVVEKPTPEQLRQYGLEKPTERWQLLAGGKPVLQLLIGTLDKSGRAYAKLADRDLIFLLDSKLTTMALGEFRTRAVWRDPIDAAQVVALQIGATRLEKDGNQWKVVGKPEAHVQSEAISETLATLAVLKLTRYVEDKGADLKLYGLAPPAQVLEISTPSGKKTLHLGNLADGTKQRYARLPESATSDVFLLDEADSAKLMRDLAAYTRASGK